MTFSRPGLHSTNLEAVLNTLEHERYARGALLAAFLDDLRELASDDRAPESTRDLLARAATGEMKDAEFTTLLDELRAVARNAA
jgi:hypothetical protein